MTNEQLRMQMLAGIITEGQYKEMLAENIFTYTLLKKGEEVVNIEASDMSEANKKVIEMYPGSDPMLTHIDGKLIDWKKSNF
jgi:hypothetical protein